MMTMNYELLSRDHPEWGGVAVDREDSETFGFAVADLRVGDVAQSLSSRDEFSEALERWAAAHQVEVIGCSASAADKAMRSLLPSLGFHYVDTSLRFALPRLQTLRLPAKHWDIRPADEADRSAIEAIAGGGFRAGRYHADPRFPRELANKRFRKFVTEAMREPAYGKHRTYVTGRPAKVFIQITIEPPAAFVTLGGTTPKVQGTPAPLTLWFGAMLELQRMGIRRVESKLSASNTAMINVATSTGARFSDAEHIFHWHAPNARHLLAADAPSA